MGNQSFGGGVILLLGGVCAGLVGFGPAVSPVAGAPSVVQEIDEALKLGERVYGEQCQSCHGREGRGDGPAARFLDPIPRDFTQGAWQYIEEENAEALAGIVRDGIDDTGMTPFAGLLTEEEIEAVASYVLEVLRKPSEGESGRLERGSEGRSGR